MERVRAHPCHIHAALIAGHGFSVMVTVTKDGRDHRFLFDAGTSPDGAVENMRRLDIEPGSIEASSAATVISDIRPGSMG